MSLVIQILIAFLVIICLLMIVTILMQRPKSEGLGAAFGGGLTDNLFGAQTTTVFSVLHVRESSGMTSIQKQLMKSPLPSSSGPAAK